MDYIWIAVAFVCGFLAKQINLPPLIGYLAAGFGLHALGFEPDELLETMAELGVTLLLFTIGLKLNIRSLFKTEVWIGAAGHMSAIVLLTMLSCLMFASLGVAYFSGLDLPTAALIGFAVSFSSTVCAVQVLEEKGEVKARHGQIAIAILIIQDIVAVIFVTFATGESPSWWALSLLALPLFRPLLFKLLARSGHGEVLLLAGFFLAFSGAELFKAVGLEAHLGALVMAALLSGHGKSVELAKSLMSFKDVFLIGFFLSIGFTALPTVEMLGVAVIMAIALPIKAGLLFIFLTRLKVRGRTAFLTALNLANYSEFGLIVCSVSVMHGLLSKEWLVIMALTVSLSFIFSSIINIKAHVLYARWSSYISRFERLERLPEDNFSQPKGASVLVLGMGRVGTGAYDSMQENSKNDVCGVDVDRGRVASHCDAGRKVIAADAEDPNFWSHIQLDTIELIMLSMPNYQDAIEVIKQIQYAGYQGKIAGIARYRDEEKQLLEAGINVVFNFYAKAGTGLADESIHLLDRK
jgi:glutathione-regulated potassium-efflux system ancillary protein KefC